MQWFVVNVENQPRVLFVGKSLCHQHIRRHQKLYLIDFVNQYDSGAVNQTGRTKLNRK